MSKHSRTPILDPILMALRSRRVIIAVVSLIVALVVAYVPELAHVQDALIIVIGTVAVALIGGLSWEDAAAASRERAQTPVGQPNDELRTLIVNILAEFGFIGGSALPAPREEDTRS